MTHRAHYLTVRGNYGRGYPSARLQYHSTCDCGWIGTLVENPVESSQQYSDHVGQGQGLRPLSPMYRDILKLREENTSLRSEIARLKDLLESIGHAVKMKEF